MERWQAIEDRLHEETSLRYPENIVRKLFQEVVNKLFDEIETEIMEWIYESFLVSCTDKYLDLRGEEYSITRNNNETDESYRQRILNMISSYLTVNFMKKQGFILYSIKSLESNTRTEMTSSNSYLNNVYMVIPKHALARKFLLNDTIYEYNMVDYLKGW